MTVQEILDRAACISCLDSKTLEVLQTQLLSDILSGGASSVVYIATDVADVRAQTTRYAIVRIPSIGWDFNWIAASVGVDDGTTVLKPDDLGAGNPGRYERFI